MDNEIEVITDADEDSSNKKVIEQTIYVPELENGLVRMDMNIIEYPLFTKNRRIKPNVRVRFVINDNRNKTIEIIPAADEVVPGEFEKLEGCRDEDRLFGGAHGDRFRLRRR